VLDYSYYKAPYLAYINVMLTVKRYTYAEHELRERLTLELAAVAAAGKNSLSSSA